MGMGGVVICETAELAINRMLKMKEKERAVCLFIVENFEWIVVGKDRKKSQAQARIISHKGTKNFN